MSLRSFLIMSFVTTIVACVPMVSVDHYKHPEFGEVPSTSTVYQKDYLQCRKSVYKKGVLVNGNQSFDEKEIMPFYLEYFRWQHKAKIDKKNTDSAISKGVASATGYGYSNVKMAEMPEEYADVKRAHDEITSCMSTKSWVPTRRKSVPRSEVFPKNA